MTVIEEILSDFMKENPGIRVSYESLKEMNTMKPWESVLTRERVTMYSW